MKPKAAAPVAPSTVRKTVVFGTIAKSAGHRILLYGSGGIGKTTLCTALPGKTAFFDLEDSLSRLQAQIDLSNVVTLPCDDWMTIRTTLQSDGWESVNNIVIDTGTKLEELCLSHMLSTLQTEKGSKATSIESYGYGKGYSHLFETWLHIYADLDRHARAGRNVVIIAHEAVDNVPNPEGDDWLRYEPRLRKKSCNIQARTKEWSDHTLAILYDVNVSKDGVGQGTGSRTLYRSERPHCMAKSRTGSEPIPITPENGADVWAEIVK